jgi:hypothetical protein
VNLLHTGPFYFFLFLFFISFPKGEKKKKQKSSVYKDRPLGKFINPNNNPVQLGRKEGRKGREREKKKIKSTFDDNQLYIQYTV